MVRVNEELPPLSSEERERLAELAQHYEDRYLAERCLRLLAQLDRAERLSAELFASLSQLIATHPAAHQSDDLIQRRLSGEPTTMEGRSVREHAESLVRARAIQRKVLALRDTDSEAGK
jgi:hypothetical protein